MTDIVENLLKRAQAARAEGDVTALVDAVHFEESAAEIERLRAASEWRDISTAPRDGKPFWALQGEKHFECWWYEDWPRTDGYWMDHSDSEPEPTHWQPLPAPPQRNEVKK